MQTKITLYDNMAVANQIVMVMSACTRCGWMKYHST